MPTRTIENIILEQGEEPHVACEAKLVLHVRLLNEAIEQAALDRTMLEEVIEAKNKADAEFARLMGQAKDRSDSLERLLEKSRAAKYNAAAEASKKIHQLEQDIIALKKELDLKLFNEKKNQELISAKIAENAKLENKISDLQNQNNNIQITRSEKNAEDERFRRETREKEFARDEEKNNLLLQILEIEKQKVGLEENVQKKTMEIASFEKRQIHLYATEKLNAEMQRAINAKNATIQELTEKLNDTIREMDTLQNRLNPRKEVKTRVVYLGKE